MQSKNKKATAKNIRIAKKPLEAAMPMVEMESEQEPMVVNKPPTKSVSVKVSIILAVVILAAILLVRKGYIVAAVINGRPVFTWELNNVLVKRYGTQTLDGIITEKLVMQEADKAGLNITAADVSGREDEMIKSIGTDVKLDDLLKYQGMTREEFNNQVKLQIAVEKILGKDLSFTDAQLDNFIATNSGLLTATDSASKKTEAKKILTEQEINTKVQPWLLDLKNNAKIIKML
jgi:hypothetical protein